MNGPQTCISFTLCPNLFPCDLGERIRRRFSCNDRSSRCLPTVTQQRVNASPWELGRPSADLCPKHRSSVFLVSRLNKC